MLVNRENKREKKRKEKEMLFLPISVTFTFLESQSYIPLLTSQHVMQIRAQLAACGAPIVGDSMYMPAAIAEMISPGLNPFGKYKKQYTTENDKETAVAEWIAQHGKEPGGAIGLQACQISWDDEEHFYTAGSPWWTREMS